MILFCYNQISSVVWESLGSGSLLNRLGLWFDYHNTNSERACLCKSASHNYIHDVKALSAYSE